MNTDRGTVIGEAKGDALNISKFQKWLKTTGSPSSRIDKSVFNTISEFTTKNSDANYEFVVIR